eukprot:2313481-Rhodomonas_salina.3
MDYAHSISLGYYKELYYLLFVVGGRNFMWATPTTTSLGAEDGAGRTPARLPSNHQPEDRKD